MSSTKGREVLRGQLSYKRKGNNWKKRLVVAYCGISSLEQPPSTPCAQIVIFGDYEKPGQKPKSVIRLEQAKIDSTYSNPPAYSAMVSSSQGGMRMSVSPNSCASSGSGSGIVGSGSGSGTVGSSVHVFSVVIKNGEVNEFRTETENERIRWVRLLQLLVMFPFSSIPDEPKTNPIKDTFRLRLDAVKYGANSVWPVYILPEEVGGRCGIIGINVLALKSGYNQQVGTLNIYNPADPTTPLITWDRDKMRRTGKTGNLVFIEIGRRCYGGPGLVWMYSGFNDAQSLRETLHNFLFKGDGNAVAIPTQQPTLYDAPRASFDAHFPPSYQRENSIGSLGNASNPILSRSRSNDHDSGFVGSPSGNSFMSPKLEGPPVRLDKHPSIRRKRDASNPREIRRGSSVSSYAGSFSESVEVTSAHDDSQSRSLSPQDDCDGDVVGAMDPEHSSSNVRLYDVVPQHSGNHSHRVIMSGHTSEYETMIHPRSAIGQDLCEGYVKMSPAPQSSMYLEGLGQSSVPQPSNGGELYNTLQHLPSKQSPQARNNYDTLPTIRETQKAPEILSESPSNYVNHPLPNDLKSISPQTYTPNYQNVELARQGRKGSLNQDSYENVDANGDQIRNVNGNNSVRRLSMRRISEREDVQLSTQGNGAHVNGVQVTNSPPKSEGNGAYVQFQRNDLSSGKPQSGTNPIEYKKINQHSTMCEQRASEIQQPLVR